MSERKVGQKIRQNLGRRPALSLDEAYGRLREIPSWGPATGGGEYLHQVYVEDGVAVATNAHVAVAIRVDCLEGKRAYLDSLYGRNLHKGDVQEVDLDEGVVRNRCDHKTDKSVEVPIAFGEEGIYGEYSPMEKLWPDPTEAGPVQTCLNGTYVGRVADILAPNTGNVSMQGYDDDDENAPIIVGGKNGVAIIMPMSPNSWGYEGVFSPEERKGEENSDD